MAETQTVWGWMIAGYLFLGGLSAGVFCTTSILRFASKGGFKSTLTYGAWFATIALAVGLVCLLADVGRPFHAIILWQSFVNLSSWMAIGAWLLVAAFVIFLVTAIFSTKKITRHLSESAQHGWNIVLKVLAGIGIPVSLMVAIYTGILLGAAPGIPLWHTWLLPALFTVSALDTGIAAVLIFVVTKDRDVRAHNLHRTLMWVVILLVILEVAAIAFYYVTMQSRAVSEQLSIGLIFNGSLSVPFWALVIIVGLAIPLIVDVIQQFLPKSEDHENRSKARIIIPVCAAACTLIGGFTLRYVVLAAGIHHILINPAVVEALKGSYFFFN